MFSWQKHATMSHHPTALPPTGARDTEESRRFNEFPASMKKKIQGGETFFDKSHHKNATAVAGSQKRRGAAAFLKADQNGHSLH